MGSLTRPYNGYHYVYNLNSGALAPGTYRVNISIGGSAVGSSALGLK
jgi:hypothetical protein